MRLNLIDGIGGNSHNKPQFVILDYKPNKFKKHNISGVISLCGAMSSPINENINTYFKSLSKAFLIVS